MAHTTKLVDGLVAHHDSSLDAESVVTITKPSDDSFTPVELPYEVFTMLVADQVRNQQIAALEQASDDDVLKGVVPPPTWMGA
ncbi:hypothetical protein [Neptuniibacter sp. QD37_11]|uniref:hypothetical protein n=1 Tax=Neptuniibacter sp. QD37_11 TaxID=3398209 RepID=UPI0039F56D8C